ncbi:helix-turn-helix transcriptional regulator [filamentous cyanobacterium LEGE 11480]|uniref:Helix-turn-helix transcriptional regulator n=1 Tax=Romeriopsis navalis LEGE 11480 TaxID=2777977 RepID=A0A928VUM0_9CYAN|nr:helix-turn-helix transcriptional regulator [Romeriopsis navalis]MBE9032875.1 helix-turn-helix transcriptional regulator [Romeriopsis navalis LEGE 11480]
MKPGSKYYRLFQYLQANNQPEITLSIDYIASLIDGDLSPNAREKRGWWSNRDAPSAVQARAWIQAGYHTAEIHLTQQTITFRKFKTQYNIQKKDGTIVWDHDAIKALRKHMDLTQADFSQELGVRRQTVSEWESGVYRPDRSTAKHLERIAESQNFQPQPDINHP